MLRRAPGFVIVLLACAALAAETPDPDLLRAPHCIGAYEPRWFMKYQHMDPAEAYQALRDLGARALVPIHWGTFDLTDEPLDLPPVELGRAVVAAGGDPAAVHVLAVGERWHVPKPDF